MKNPAAAAACGLVALAVAMGIGRFAFTPILPMMQADAGIGIVEGGWLASANYLGYLVGALSALALPFAPGVVIRLGLGAVAVSTLAMASTSHMGAWIALRFLAGVASAWVLVYTSAWCLERFQHESKPNVRARLSATLFAGVGVGIALAGSICLALILQGQDSSTAWIALGVLALAAALGIPARFGDSPAAHPQARAGSPSWNAHALRLVACYGALGFGYIIPATFIATMARDLLRDPALYGWSWPAFGAAAAASTFVAAALRTHASDRNLWIGGHLVMAVGVLLPSAVPGSVGIGASALLVGGTFMVVTMAGMQEARRLAGPSARRLMAAMTSAFAAGQIAGPLAVSALAAAGYGYGPALGAAGAILVLSALALAPNPKGEHR